jgi:hypothetical protein
VVCTLHLNRRELTAVETFYRFSNAGAMTPQILSALIEQHASTGVSSVALQLAMETSRPKMLNLKTSNTQFLEGDLPNPPIHQFPLER